MADSVRVNGNEYSWGSIIVKIDGEVFYGFTEISFGHKRTRSKVYGMGRHHAPRGRTRGKYEVDPVKLKGPLRTWKALREKLASMSESGTSYGDVPFQIVVQYLEGDEEVTYEFEDNVIAGETNSHSEGPDALEEEVELDTMGIRKNGLTLWEE